jgi:hypothetical protein
VIPDDDSLVVSKRAAKKDILLTFSLPKSAFPWWPFQRTITVAGDDKVQFYARAQTNFTSPITTGLISFVVTAVIYFFVSQCVFGWEGLKKLRVPKSKQEELTRCRYLDPVVLSSGPNGEGSISRLQILFFSFLVFFLLLYILLKVGQLSALSDTVLILMGISGIGAGLAKATELGKERLSFKNWAWLIDRKWLPENGLAASKVARWKDLVTSADGVDVYHVRCSFSAWLLA